MDSRPLYRHIPAKFDLILQLQQAAIRADEIFIATDPDREGESIAYHLQYILKDQNKPIWRIDLTELSSEAILSQLRQPRKINHHEVLACQARYVVDRLVGARISPLLNPSNKKLLSAGRVQSAALALICEREKFIIRNQSKMDRKIQIKFRSADGTFFSGLVLHPLKNDLSCFSEKARHALYTNLINQRLTIRAVSIEEFQLAQLAPLNTSCLLQEAIPYLGKSGKAIMRQLQHLYEGVEMDRTGLTSLITYPRTEGKVFNPVAIREIYSFCDRQYSENDWVFREDIQNHGPWKEAIRPLHVNEIMAPATVKNVLSKNLFALYEFIWNRTLAVFLKPPQFQKITLSLGDEVGCFKVVCFRTRRAGYSAILSAYPGKPEPLAERAFQKGEQIMVNDIFQSDQHPRYRESDLIHELDQLGIGRPGTLAEILPLLLKRGYATIKDGLIEPTLLGEKINDFLQLHFNSVFRLTATMELEKELSRISEGAQNYGTTVSRFQQNLQRAMDDYLIHKRSVDGNKDRLCEHCGMPMIKRRDRRGVFWSCRSDLHGTK